MANDGSLISQIEQWMADTLAALTFNNKDVFRTAQVWKHQIAATQSGMQAFTRHQPFAFVSRRDVDSAREGGYDLRQVLEFAVLIGVESKSKGVARFGDSRHLGTSKIRDLVITCFEKKHPGGSLTCDEFYYTGEIEVFDGPKLHAVQMHFETSQLTPN
jgi:hypothetical protein